MKRIALIYTVILLFSGMIKLQAQQCTLPYKPILLFNNNTEAFINYNFSDRADCYKDKTLADVIVDLKIPIKSFLYSGNEENSFLYDGISIYFAPMDYIRYRELFKGEFFSSIVIRWKTPQDFKVLKPLLKTAEVNWTNWTPEVENLLKNIPIGEVGTLKR